MDIFFRISMRGFWMIRNAGTAGKEVRTMGLWKRFLTEEDALGTVEIILIIVVNLTLQKGVWIAYIK